MIKTANYYRILFSYQTSTPKIQPQSLKGMKKVVRPRLTDAEFFFKTDLKQKLVDRLPRLETVLFQQQLGTLKDKTDRIEQLAGENCKTNRCRRSKSKTCGFTVKM